MAVGIVSALFTFQRTILPFPDPLRHPCVGVRGCPGTQNQASLKTSGSRWVRLRPAVSGNVPGHVPKSICCQDQSPGCRAGENHNIEQDSWDVPGPTICRAVHTRWGWGLNHPGLSHAPSGPASDH